MLYSTKNHTDLECNETSSQAPSMATPCEAFLTSHTPTSRTSPACKVVWFTISLATIVTLASLLTLQPSSIYFDPCAVSHNPSSCRSIISDALLLGGPHPTPSLNAFHNILHKQMVTIDSVISVAATINAVDLQPRQQTAINDCLHLLDLSRDRLETAAGPHARTWISAVLTNYDTCLDGLEGSVPSAMEMELKTLMQLASASLAVLNSVNSSSSTEIATVVSKFPEWLSRSDRSLLEAPSAKAINANAVVAKDGSGKYRTVQQAVDAAPDNSKKRHVIYVKKGVYKETVRIGKTKKNLMLTGDGQATVITGSLNYVDGTSTFDSPTLAAVGDGLILQDLKIENTAGSVKHQAVALRVGADQAVINRCTIEAYQDTLYAHTLRQFYRDCTISGTVDFIFGNAAVVFQNCKLIARRPLNNQYNLVTAQGRTDGNQNTGTSIQKCRIVPSADLEPVKGSLRTYLGRPWKEYSRTVVMQSYIDNHVDPKGWHEWDGYFALDTLFYGEYQNYGPGAGTSGRVNWRGFQVIKDVNTAWSFTVSGLIQGASWISSAGVDFINGL